MNILNDIELIEQKVVSFFKGNLQTDAAIVLTASNKFLNTIKVLSTSATGQTVIDLAEAFFPAITGVVNGAETVLSKLINITAETPGGLLLQEVQKAATLTGVAQVASYTNIGTAIASVANDLYKCSLTPQQIISVIQLVHSPDVLSVPTATPVISTGAIPKN